MSTRERVIQPSMQAPAQRIEVQPAQPASADFDAQLMLQWQAGNANAADALIRRNFDRVSRYVARLVRNPRAVEDLTQDVFLQVMRNGARYEPTARFSTWLYRIATNTALNHLNEAAVRRQRNLGDRDAEAVLPSGGGAAPDCRMSLDEIRAKVAGAIGQLPVNQRIALTLFEYEAMNYEQIAEVLESTVDSVRSLLRRARLTLRDQLADLL